MYSQDVADKICERIAQGEPLAQICRDEGMPGRQRVYEWMEADPVFAGHFARARQAGYDAIADEILEIADDGRNDWMEMQAKREGDGPTIAFNAEHVQRSKLRAEMRLKLLAKWDPKRYGEKIETTHQAGQSLTDMVTGSYKASQD